MRIERSGDVGILYIDTGRNNAFNLASFAEMNSVLDEAEDDDAILAMVVTSSHRTMFSPGVDLPSVIEYPPADVRRLFEEMTRLFRRSFTFPKAQVYALNGHAIGAGCMLALGGEYRLMATGPVRVGITEINLGLAAPAGTVQMIRHVLGGHAADEILLGGTTYSAIEACTLGLVDESVERDSLIERATERAHHLGNMPQDAFRRLKGYLRADVAQQIQSLDESHLDDVVAQWFDDRTQRRLASAVARLQKAL